MTIATAHFATTKNTSVGTMTGFPYPVIHNQMSHPNVTFRFGTPAKLTAARVSFLDSLLNKCTM